MHRLPIRYLISVVLIVAILSQQALPTKAAEPAQATQLSSAARQRMQTTLDILVAQSIGASGWKILDTQSQLDEASLQISAAHQAGRGTWHISTLDDRQHSIMLEGPLDFEIAGQKISGNADGTTSIKGSLKGPDVELALDTGQTGKVAAQAVTANMTFSTQIKREGKTLQNSIKVTIDEKPIAYKMTRSSALIAIDHDGQQTTWTQSLTRHDLGGGEIEYWLSAALTSQANQPPELTVNQHSFQHVVGSAEAPGILGGAEITQYIDGLDMQMLGHKLTLQSPASATLTPKGQLKSDLVLVDDQGNTYPVKTASAKAPGPARPVPPDALASSLPALNYPCSQRMDDFVDFVVGFTISLIIFLLGGEILTAGAILLLILENLLGTLIGRYFKNRPDADAPNIKGINLLLQVILGILFAKGGDSSKLKYILNLSKEQTEGGLVNLLLELFGVSDWTANYFPTKSLCNGDPYFVFPTGIQQIKSPSDSVQVLHVSGGLVAPPTADSSDLNARVQSSADYDDRPEAFVGGAAPGDATTIGEWNWDTNRPFGAALSHTQAAAPGPQKHYFLRASKPLQVGADDNIIQYVYLDPNNLPAEIYLQFYTGDGDGEHRAYWGADRVQTGGKADAPSLLPIGALPTSGGWVRLKVAAEKLGLNGKPINGILYGAYDGQTWWGPTTTSSNITDRAPDGLPVRTPDTLPASVPGAQIAYQVAGPSKLTIEIADSSGKAVRTLCKDRAVQPGYYVEVWDGKDDTGVQLPDKPYTIRFQNGGQTAAQSSVSISPFVASLQTPSSFSLIRGNDVPVIGEAYGPQFSRYVVEYGEGLNPTTWKTISTAESPVMLPKRKPMGTHGIGNLANWDAGVNEFKYWNNAGLNGVYTLRLRVIGKDGREASDSVVVIVGRLAHSAEGGTITSPHGSARLLIPPLAIRDSFVLMALVPASQVEPGGDWQSSLPADKKQIGELYEVLPGDIQFRRPATLELPYDPAVPADKVGIMLGDGQSWHYIGGRADPDRKVVSATVTEFAGSKVLAAVFRADQFGPAQLTRPAPQPFSFTPTAPIIASGSHPAAFYADFASTAGEVAALDQFGTQLTIVTGAEAGLPGDNAALKVSRLEDGVRLVQLRATPYDASKYPILSFDYRLPPGYFPNILVESSGVWHQFKTGENSFAASRYFETAAAPEMVADGTWHHYQIDLLARLRDSAAENGLVQVESIVLGQAQSGPYMQVNLVENGSQDAYYLTNIAVLAPTTLLKPEVTLSAPAGAKYSAYNFALDQKTDTVPPEQDQELTANLTLSPNAPDGLWYLHVRGKTADGRWGSTGHYPLLIDRQPPTFGQPMPAPGSADTPSVIAVPIFDAIGGVDPASIKFSLNGQAYSAGPGARYDPQGRVFVISPYSLKPPLPSVANGQKVEVSVLSLADYAGNRLSAPFSWHFTVDQVRVTGSDFHALVPDGQSPALSPDASQLAFVSTRSGVQKIWIIRADDYDDKARSARALIGGNTPARESDPAWSPDAKLLAYVSDGNVSPQIWVAGADGSGPHTLTIPNSGIVASPTWSPDGKTLAFIQDGNLWQVNADGSGQHALTRFADQPYQSVRWQPGGQLLALAFNLYEQRIELYDSATGEIRQLTKEGKERQPAWLNAQTVLFTAPAGQGQADAIWQVNVDGSGQSLLTGSGQPGVEDMQADVSADGSAVALVSTRGGARAIWLQAMFQVSQFNVDPASGSAAGKPLQITYTLPVESDVTLQVLRPDGSLARMLLDKVRQSKGVQHANWNGTDSKDQPLAAGQYLVKLSVKLGSGADPVERLITANVIDPATIGSLHVQVNQWAGQLVQKFNGSVGIYPSAVRMRAIASVDGNGAPTFDLPAGKYDLVVTLGGLRREITGISVDPGKTVAQTVDLGLGGLNVSILAAPGQPIAGSAFVTISRSDDTTGAIADYAIGSVLDFALLPGSYDIRNEFQGVRQFSYGIQVTAGQITKREINLGSGVLRVNALSSAGKPLDRQFILEAFSPQDHQKSVGATWGTAPVDLRLPAGTYDLHITAVASSASRLNVAADINQWFNGVQIQPGETRSQDYNLRLGQIQVQVLEATGKPADEKRVSFCIVRQGERTCNNPVLVASAINTVQALLPAGVYEVIPDYSGTALTRLGPIGTPFEVKEGQTVSQTFNLKLGRIQVQVTDASGQPIRFERLQISAFLPGKREVRDYFSHVASLSPVDLVVQAGTPYDLEIYLDGSKRIILDAQALNEGETRTLTFKEADFK